MKYATERMQSTGQGAALPLNFLVLGAAKGGTTSLHDVFERHPDVYVTPIKETRFFAYEGETLDFQGPGDHNANAITDLASYRQQYAGVTTETAIGEVCPIYLYSEKAAHRIKHHVPQARLLAVLRNPVDRAYSHYMHHVRLGRSPDATFEDALADEPRRVAANWDWGWHYTQCGFYFEQVKRYVDLFGKEQLRVYIFEQDFARNPTAMVHDALTFIGADPARSPEILHANVSGVPKNKIVQQLLFKGNPLKRLVRSVLPSGMYKRMGADLKKRALERPPLSAETRERLTAGYREDILRLQDLLQRDLSVWLKAASTAA